MKTALRCLRPCCLTRRQLHHLRVLILSINQSIILFADTNVSQWAHAIQRSILNAIINKKTNTSKLPSHFECNEINIVSKQSIADGFNNFFVSVGSNLDKITVADNAASIYDYMGQQCPNSMFINPVSEDEVVNIIKSCKPKQSKDCDDINM